MVLKPRILRVSSNLYNASNISCWFVCLFVLSDVLNPYAYAPPWTPLNPGFYSISGGCRNSYLFYTTVHHGK